MVIIEKKENSTNKDRNSDHINLPVENKETTENTTKGRFIKEKDIKHIKKLLNNVFKFNNEKATLIMAQHLYNEYINLDSATQLITELGGDIDTLKEVYYKFKTTTDPISKIITESGETLDNALLIEDEILNRISIPKNLGGLSEKIEENIYIVIDPEKKETYKEIITYNHKGYENRNEVKIIDASLKELTVYDNPVVEEIRQFKSVWNTQLRSYPLIIGPDSATETAAKLSESGYIIKKRDGEDVVKICFNIFIKKQLAEMKTEIESPGFYFNSKGRLEAIKFEVGKEVKKTELQKALKTLEDFGDYFPGQKVQLATVFKWGLIAPFIFAIKQKGGWVRIPFLYGNAGTGKSTFGKTVLYIWGEPNNDTNMIPGSGFDTEARIGDRLKQFTFPIVIDEPGALFERKGPSEMIKTAIEQTTSRGKYIGRQYRTIPAYASFMFTSNYKYPDEDAFNRRFYPIPFYRRERKTQAQRKKFDKYFNFDNVKECKLHDFKALGQYVAIEILNNPELLDTDWKVLVNDLLVRMYMEVGITPPEWILEWFKIETMSDLDEFYKEDIRNFLVEEINRAFGHIQIMDEEGRPRKDYDSKFDVKGPEDFKNIVWSVLNHRKIPWALLGANDTVYITVGILSDLKKKVGINESLPSLGDLLGWKYSKGNIKSAGFSGAHLRVDRIKFTEFVFPFCGDGG